MSRSEEMAGLVSQVYDAALDAGRWNTFLARLGRVLRSDSSVLHLQSVRGRQNGRVVAAVGVDAKDEQRYNEYYAGVNIWTLRGRHLLREGAVLTGEMVCPNADLERSEYYCDYLRPLGFYHSIASTPSADDDTTLIVSCLRSRAQGAFDDEEVALLRRLTPHLKHAATIHDRLTSAAIQWSALEALLDHLPLGIVLLDDRGGVVLANRRARDIAARGDGLCLTPAGVRATGRADDGVLREQIGRAMPAAQESDGSAGVVRVSRPSGERALEILVVPLPRSSRGALLSRDARAALFLVDPAEHTPVAEDLLQRLHGLTRSEARFAVALAQGQRPQDIADGRQLTRESARWVVKQILQKTDSRTQSQAVVRILRGLAALSFPAEPGNQAG